jgi:predicted nucleic acid-binding protein
LEKKDYLYGMKQRIYIDTSVFGGYYDEEFEKYTIPLFDRIGNGEFIVLLSAVTQDELKNAPEKVQKLV